MRFVLVLLLFCLGSSLFGQDPLRPGRLMIATGRFERFGGPSNPPIQAAPVRVTQTHEIPYVQNVPFYYPDPNTLPSNQDIKDGVNRPDDTLRIPFLTVNSIDYYQQFRATR